MRRAPGSARLRLVLVPDKMQLRLQRGPERVEDEVSLKLTGHSRG